MTGQTKHAMAILGIAFAVIVARIAGPLATLNAWIPLFVPL